MSRSGETTTEPSQAPRSGQAAAGKPGGAGRAPAEIFGCFVGTLAKLESSGAVESAGGRPANGKEGGR